MRSAIAPPSSAIVTSGTSSTAPSRPVRKAEPGLDVELVGQRDERGLGPEARDEVAEHEQPQVARRAQRLEVDHDARAAGHRPRAYEAPAAARRPATCQHRGVPVVGSIPSPSFNGIHVGPFDIRIYGLCYVLAVLAAVAITTRRWEAQGGSRELVQDVALWGFPAGIIGGRLYFLATSWNEVPDHWWGPFAVWEGGLGIWGGIALGTAVGIWRLRRAGADVPRFLDAAAPALLVAQAIGRVGNYFNQELYGRPTSLPWGLEIDPEHRPARYADSATFHPTFLYEIIWNLALAAFLVWLGAPPRDPPARALRPLRRRLLGLPDLRGAAARRPGQARPRPAPELLHRRGAHRRRADVVRAHPAPRQGQSPHEEEPMRIVVFGAGGRVGTRTVAEALARGHEVTAVVRDPEAHDLHGRRPDRRRRRRHRSRQRGRGRRRPRPRDQHRRHRASQGARDAPGRRARPARGALARRRRRA